MKLNYRLGEIYDTLRYFEIYFNYDKVIQDLENRNYNVEEGLKYYKRIKIDIELLPQLQAFFNLNKGVSLLSYIFINNINSISTIKDYYLLIKNKE